MSFLSNECDPVSFSFSSQDERTDAAALLSSFSAVRRGSTPFRSITACSSECAQLLLRVGSVQARRRGVPLQDCEDCALEFVAHFLTSLSRPTPRFQEVLSNQANAAFHAWVHRCAINHAHNYRSSLQRERIRCACCACLTIDTDRIPHAAEPVAERSARQALRRQETESASASVFIAEFWERVTPLLLCLTAEQKAAFQACVLDDLPVRLVAERMACDPNAVSHLLSRARKRLRRLAERQGLTENTLLQYLSP